MLGRHTLLVTFLRHRRARHYILRLDAGGGLRVTVPRGGSREEAIRFVRAKAAWIERERYRAALRRSKSADGAVPSIRLRGEELPIDTVQEAGVRVARFGSFRLALPSGTGSPRPAVERFVRRLAERELRSRLAELAATHGIAVSGVTVRGQRTRWGSCSPAGRISLNWRLVQLPPSVSDYVILHELAHLSHLNHSRRFWKEVARICPWHEEARAWLRKNAQGLQLG